MSVKFTPEALEYFNALSTILYEKDYFGFEDSALEYVDTLITEIIETLPNRQKKIAPEYFSRYGKYLYYATFKKNDNTQWYVFFNYEDDIFLIRYISNNHVIAQYI